MTLRGNKKTVKILRGNIGSYADGRPEQFGVDRLMIWYEYRSAVIHPSVPRHRG